MRQTLQKIYGMASDAIMLLSVGELNENKNHQIVIRALAKIKDNRVHYFIAGNGNDGMKKKLVDLAGQLGISDRIHLLGYRADVPELMQAADIYLLPSLREGLNVSLMEAMAAGLPVVCSKIRGNVDLIVDNKCLVEASDVERWRNALERLIVSSTTELKLYGDKNYELIRKCDSSRIIRKMKYIYVETIQ